MVQASARQAARGQGLIPPPGDLGGGGWFEAAFIWEPHAARKIPGVDGAVLKIAGSVAQMAMDTYRGDDVLERPPLLSRPDPTHGRSWFVTCHIEDYLLDGNALSYVTSRSQSTGWPTSMAWLPAAAVTIMADQTTNGTEVSYWFRGERLDTENVIHVMRSADRRFPVRGVGVVEQHLASLDRIMLEEEYERSALAGGAVPSVAVITPNPRLDQETADEAKQAWMAKFGGAVREPVILPNGTQVIPLAWSPSDTQLVEARKLSLTDIANMFGIDGVWLNAPASSHTYRNTAALFIILLRSTIEPILANFEDIWSYAWLPRGQRMHFDRSVLVQEDMSTRVDNVIKLFDRGLMTMVEARKHLALPAVAGVEPLSPAPAIA